MSVSRRIFVAAGLFGFGSAAMSLAAELPGAGALESGLGDSVHLDIDEQAEPGATDVILCLENQTPNGAKGFDIRRASGPRFLATPNGAVCTRVVPGRHKLYLWKIVDQKFQVVILSDLDLSKAAGARVLISWRSDTPADNGRNHRRTPG